MAFAGGFGMHLDLRRMPCDSSIDRADTLLYSETASHFVATVPPRHRAAFLDLRQPCVIGEIGRVLDTPDFTIVGLSGGVVVHSDIATLKEAWQRPLRW
jgi:hypothetical protein